jgi:hypothetical protein
MFHCYDPLPNTDDVTASVAVHECQNCGKACETLTYLEGWNFNACDACAEEAAREDERAEAVPYCKQCFCEVDDAGDLNRADMCLGCAAEAAREFWAEHRRCA